MDAPLSCLVYTNALNPDAEASVVSAEKDLMNKIRHPKSLIRRHSAPEISSSRLDLLHRFKTDDDRQERQGIISGQYAISDEECLISGPE